MPERGNCNRKSGMKNIGSAEGTSAEMQGETLPLGELFVPLMDVSLSKVLKITLDKSNRTLYTGYMFHTSSIQEPIAEAYHKLFDGAVADFNAKQKRADRKKKESYFEDLFNRPPCQTVLTAANKENSF